MQVGQRPLVRAGLVVVGFAALATAVACPIVEGVTGSYPTTKGYPLELVAPVYFLSCAVPIYGPIMGLLVTDRSNTFLRRDLTGPQWMFVGFLSAQVVGFALSLLGGLTAPPSTPSHLPPGKAPQLQVTVTPVGPSGSAGATLTLAL
jgi:hypothetical protein